VSISHLTDFVGLEESPALSPDGKYVAFTADHSGNRQVMIRLLSGGAPLQITNDQADHTSPRWSADSGSIVYYVPPTTADEKEGTVWQVSALGGSQRRLFSSISDVDISHQGAKVAYFAVNGDKTELRVADLDGMHSRTVKDFPSNLLLFHPRWSPDDSQIAFQIGDWPNGRIAAISANGGQMRDITSGQVYTRGFAWLPKGDGIVVSSSLGSSVFYQATLNLWEYSLKGGAPRQLTFNVSSYVDPDISSTGQMVATHVDAQYNIWRIPVSGDATENVKKAVQVTRQTGLVQTPSVSPDDRYLVYLADAGRHANLWILDIEKGDRRQLTFEEDPNVMIGVPIWSPDGKHIAYFTLQYSGKDWFSRNQEWVIDPDGSNPRALVDAAAFACWSPDSKWVYFAENRGQGYTGLGRVSLDGKVEKVRPENEKGLAPAISPDGKSLYFVLNSASENGRIKSEIRVASLPDGPSRLLTTISGSMIPAGVPVIQPIVSPDGKWLALLLHGQNNDEIWLLSPAGGTMHRMTDFGDRRISLARRVSWSPDSRFIYAALGDHDSDIVSIADLVAH
jgi:Tol biopolymer transport system component